MANQLNLYGTIGSDVRAVDVKKTLAAMDQTQPLVVNIDSDGGSVFDGFSIGNALAEYPGPKKIVVQPTAFSIASYIVAVFDDVDIVANGYIMAHLPYSESSGTAAEHENQAELLKDIEAKLIDRYVAKTGFDEFQIRSMLEKETFLNADQAVQMNLASRVIDDNTKTRIVAKNKKVPLTVLASLRCDGRGGDNREDQKDNSMSTQAPVAATVQEIKAAYPKAKAEFIVKCLERSLPMASVATAAAEEMMTENDTLRNENEELKNKLKAFEDKEAAAKAEAETEPDGDEPLPEKKDEPQNKVKGAKPMARVSTGGPGGSGSVSAKAKWDSLIKAEMDKGKRASQATDIVARANPELRKQMLAEVNA